MIRCAGCGEDLSTWPASRGAHTCPPAPVFDPVYLDVRLPHFPCANTGAGMGEDWQVDDATAMHYLTTSHDYARIPSHLRPGLEHWIREARPVGGFLSALLANDLSRAIALADHQSLYALPVLVSWLTNRAPSPCWGSPEKVAAWHGLPQWIDVA